jgi:uncharacterized protein
MMNKFQKIQKIVEKEVDCAAHGMDHIMRVYNMSLTLAKGEKVDLEVLRAAALLHDIGGPREMADPTGKTDHAVESAKMAGPILKKLGFSDQKIVHVQACIVSHRYRSDNRPQTLEAKILFDADKLDVLGAIGIARGLAWVGKNGAYIFRKMDLKKYAKENLADGKIGGRIKDKTKHSPQMDFETKLKFIPGKLYTKKAKRIGKERLKYTADFLRRLEKEVSAKT